eukprot:10104760-Ditylum_brightwellii.AAC.1
MFPNIGIIEAKPNFVCTPFKDNKDAEELGKASKDRPSTKHIAAKYHHFRQAVENEILSITIIDDQDQKQTSSP